MGTSDAQKRANMRWDAKNTKHYGVKMANREATAFDEACQRRGITPHSVFLAAARALIAEEASTGGDEATTGGT